MVRRAEGGLRLLHVPLAERCFMKPDELPGKWRKLGQQQRRLGAEAQAAVLEYCADEPEASWAGSRRRSPADTALGGSRDRSG